MSACDGPPSPRSPGSNRSSAPRSPELRDGQYESWDVEMATRFPLALSEMRWPSVPLHMVETQPLARWGLDVQAGWRPLVERLLARLEGMITAQPVNERDGFRILQVTRARTCATSCRGPTATSGSPSTAAATSRLTLDPLAVRRFGLGLSFGWPVVNRECR
jgi:hypothetical protein